MFNPSRDEARRFFIDAWTKFRDSKPLTPLEAQVADIVGLHPEYHAILEAGDRFLDRDYSPEGGETNPFLHLSFHLAIAEQLSIDQPPGIRAQYQRLLHALGDAHDALHEVMDCLSETIWQAQRYGRPPDMAVYLGCLRKKPGPR